MRKMLFQRPSIWLLRENIQHIHLVIMRNYIVHIRQIILVYHTTRYVNKLYTRTKKDTRHQLTHLFSHFILVDQKQFESWFRSTTFQMGAAQNFIQKQDKHLTISSAVTAVTTNQKKKNLKLFKLKSLQYFCKSIKYNLFTFLTGKSHIFSFQCISLNFPF